MEENISFFVQDIYDEAYEGFQQISMLSSIICGAASASEMTWQRQEKAQEAAKCAADALDNALQDLRKLTALIHVLIP